MCNSPHIKIQLQLQFIYTDVLLTNLLTYLQRDGPMIAATNIG